MFFSVLLLVIVFGFQLIIHTEQTYCTGTYRYCQRVEDEGELAVGDRANGLDAV